METRVQSAEACNTPIEWFSNRVELLWLTPAESVVLNGHAIDATEGLGAVIAPLLKRLASAGVDGDRERVAIMVRGLLSAVAAERVVSEGAEHQDVSAQERLVVLAMQLVHSRLEDSELTSGAIARHLGVSVRTLQAAFMHSPGSVAESIRLLRLERTWIEIDTAHADDLLDLVALGTRWGFRGRDHFIRAFERRYGVHPERVGESRAAARAS